jgi:hypothetical protein
MKPLKCLLGMHDWQVVKVSDTFFWMPEYIEFKVAAKLEFNAATKRLGLSALWHM